jgi:hypothetical protein
MCTRHLLRYKQCKHNYGHEWVLCDEAKKTGIAASDCKNKTEGAQKMGNKKRCAKCAELERQLNLLELYP